MSRKVCNLKKDVLFIFFLLLLSHLEPNPAISTTPVPIILDIDVDTSDSNALLYLLNNPLISIEAITVSCGITYIDTGVENVLKILDYLDYGNISVAGGSPSPLQVNRSFPQEWRDGSYDFYGVNLPTTSYQPSHKNATALILETLRKATTPIVILALGPLTNIAKVLLTDSSIEEKIERIDIMGGAVNVSGNIGDVYPKIPNYVSEWNFYVDPHAAEIVFNSSCNIRLVPLDATNDVPITAKFKSKLKDTKEAEMSKILLKEGLFCWDELTAVAVTNPEVLTMGDCHIDIITNGTNHEGQTVRNSSAPINAEVATGANRELFENLFLKTINHEVDITKSEEKTSMETEVTSHTTTTEEITSSSNSVEPSSQATMVPLEIATLILIIIIRKKKGKNE